MRRRDRVNGAAAAPSGIELTLCAVRDRSSFCHEQVQSVSDIEKHQQTTADIATRVGRLCAQDAFGVQDAVPDFGAVLVDIG